MDNITYYSYEALKKNLPLDSFYLMDKKIIDLYPNFLDEHARVYIIENPEAHKTLESFSQICDWLFEHQGKRSDNLMVVGGGALLDLGGFVAASFKRGMGLKFIPTTLLAMVDAAIGGKTAINTSFGKNTIGSFYQAHEIMICSDFLKTLDQKEIDSGRGEILKYAFLDAKLFEMVKSDEPLEKLIKACAIFKKKIVAADFRDLNDRRCLNLGHEFGHALELSYSCPHGQCVVWGIYYILQLYRPNLLTRFDFLLKKLNLSLLDYKLEQQQERFWTFLAQDKKNLHESEVTLVIPNENFDVEYLSVSVKKLREQFVPYEK